MAKNIKSRNILYFSIASVSLVLAYIGIVMPGFPGTPFILLTAYFYLRSSDKMYNWLLRQKLFAKLINKFKENPIIPLKLKIMVLIPFWISIVVAELIFVKTLWAGITLAFVAVLVSLAVFRLKELDLNEPKNSKDTRK
jgi:uncharacterized membrane protein YbaN (DUF454 family)